jgi:D-alanyl-D-alanine carboxypeptidase
MRNKKGILIFAFLLSGLLAIWLIPQRDESPPAVTPAALVPVYDQQPVFTLPLPVVELDNSRYLELVNREHAIPGEPDSVWLTSVWPGTAVRVTGIYLHQTALEAVRGLFAASRETEAGSFFVSSGYRSQAEQRELYDNMPDKAFVQPPGHSEHETGLAVDILAMDVMQANLGTSPEGRWLAENAWRHGLILRYPADKQDITGIAYEPWHFRFVGQPHAWFCTHYNLTLEEYIGWLKENGGYIATWEGVTFFVSYERAENGTVYVPDSKPFIVSGDNTGGYIITAWE